MVDGKLRSWTSVLLLWGAATFSGEFPAIAQAQSQQASDELPTATLRVTSRVVVVSAVVKAKDGTPATGLSKDSFELKQDGKPVDIRYCVAGADLPLTIALMVDTSGSQRAFIGDEGLASDIFLQAMLGRPQDRAMVVQFDSRVRVLGGLTDSANVLHLGLTALSIDPSPTGGTLLNDGVAAVAERILSKEKGRKAIILLTDGGDNGSRASLEQAIAQAQMADVQVYSVLYSSWAGQGSLSMGLGQVGGGSDPGLQTLRKFSEATGGQVFEVSSGHTLRQIYAEIAQDLRLQYQVSYSPPPGLKPGSYHRLELHARDRRLTVEARKGFFARP